MAGCPEEKNQRGSEDFAESGIITDYGELKSISDVAQKSVVEKNNLYKSEYKSGFILFTNIISCQRISREKISRRKQ